MGTGTKKPAHLGEMSGPAPDRVILSSTQQQARHISASLIFMQVQCCIGSIQRHMSLLKMLEDVDMRCMYWSVSPGTPLAILQTHVKKSHGTPRVK